MTTEKMTEQALFPLWATVKIADDEEFGFYGKTALEVETKIMNFAKKARLVEIGEVQASPQWVKERGAQDMSREAFLQQISTKERFEALLARGEKSRLTNIFHFFRLEILRKHEESDAYRATKKLLEQEVIARKTKELYQDFVKKNLDKETIDGLNLVARWALFLEMARVADRKPSLGLWANPHYTPAMQIAMMRQLDALPWIAKEHDFRTATEQGLEPCRVCSGHDKKIHFFDCCDYARAKRLEQAPWREAATDYVGMTEQYINKKLHIYIDSYKKDQDPIMAEISYRRTWFREGLYYGWFSNIRMALA